MSSDSGVVDEVELLEQYGGNQWLTSSKRSLIKRFIRGNRVLVVGCGAGFLVSEISNRVREVFALDVDERALTYTKQKALVPLIQSDVCALSFHDESFDCIIASDVLEHISEDGIALSEMGRVLSPGGRLILTVPAVSHLFSGHDILLGHYRRYEKDDVRHLFEATGFVVKELRYWNLFSYPFVLLNKWLRGGKGQRPDKVDTVFFNSILLWILRIEGMCSFLPVGVSLFAVVHKVGNK